MKYHYLYKITNNINNHFYYGVHSTNNVNDGYMGSGSRLHKAFEKYGIENFSKEIIKFFNSLPEAYEYESKIVNQKLVNDNNCYNLVLGGKEFNKNVVLVKMQDSETFFQISTHEYYNNKDNYKTTFSDKHHSLEIKNKVRKTLTPTNSPNDRVWINKNGTVKYLLKTLLEDYLNNGWELGRTGYKPRKGCQGKIIK